jgi:hypothetical protein
VTGPTATVEHTRGPRGSWSFYIIPRISKYMVDILTHPFTLTVPTEKRKNHGKNIKYNRISRTKRAHRQRHAADGDRVLHTPGARPGARDALVTSIARPRDGKHGQTAW